MGGEWKVKKLGSIIDITSSKRIFAADYTVSGVPFYRSKEIIEKHNGNNISTELFISKNKFDVIKSQFGAPKIGDILLTSVGTIGIPYLIQKHEEFYFKDGNLTWLKTSESEVFPKYVYYWLTSPMTKQAIYEVTIGSTQQALTIIALKSLEIPFPSSAEQKSIAHILGTLDEKIELNRRMNQTLEAMAQVLFKSWFVDFDPVIDNALAAGNPIPEPFRARAIARQKLGNKRKLLPEDVQKLFPSGFVLTEEMGWVPEGWRVSVITNEASYLSRGLSPSYCENGVIVLNQKCIRNRSVDFGKARRHNNLKKNISGRELRRFDTLINSTGVGTLGRVAMMPSTNEVVIGDSHLTVMRGKNDPSSFFLSNTLLNRQDEIEALGEGSTGQTELSRAALGTVNIVMPSEVLISTFFNTTMPLLELKEKNTQRSIALSSIRDTLLPKLISGEVEISKIVNERGIG